MLAGAAYGLVARAVTAFGRIEPLGAVFVVMSIAFLVAVPAVIGAITVGAVERPSLAYRIFAPWIPILLLVAAAAIAGWEGSICIYIGLPLLLLMASLGGLTAGEVVRRSGMKPVLMAAPFLLSPVEQRIATPVRLGETVTELAIAAPPSVVWPLVASVDSIRPSELRPALYTSLGFPKPVSATLSHPGVGGVRIARFERGLEFVETVTDWVPQRRVAFTIHAHTDPKRGVVLDEHVAIGGPYFDVMTGTYELYPIDSGRATRLVLRSSHRTSTHFNPYADWWVNRIMTSIQSTIMDVHKSRAERNLTTISGE